MLRQYAISTQDLEPLSNDQKLLAFISHPAATPRPSSGWETPPHRWAGTKQNPSRVSAGTDSLGSPPQHAPGSATAVPPRPWDPSWTRGRQHLGELRVPQGGGLRNTWGSTYRHICTCIYIWKHHSIWVMTSTGFLTEGLDAAALAHGKGPPVHPSMEWILPFPWGLGFFFSKSILWKESTLRVCPSSPWQAANTHDGYNQQELYWLWVLISPELGKVLPALGMATISWSNTDVKEAQLFGLVVCFSSVHLFISSCAHSCMKALCNKTETSPPSITRVK